MEYILHSIDERRCFCPKCSDVLFVKRGIDTTLYKCLNCDKIFWIKGLGTTDKDLIAVDDIRELMEVDDGD